MNYEIKVRSVYANAKHTIHKGEALPFRIVVSTPRTAPGHSETLGKGDSLEEAWESAYDKLSYKGLINKQI